MKKVVAALFFLISCAISSQISAQVWTPAPAPQIDMQNQIWRNFRMGQIGNQIAADMARANDANKNRTGNANKPAAGSSTNNSAVFRKQFSFQRTENSLLVQKMMDAKKGSPAESMKLQQLINYTWSKYETSFADENRRLGMPFNDVISAMTYYIVVSYLYANDIPSLKSENSVAVYKQLAEVMSKDAEFSKLQPADRQLVADLLITMGGMPVLYYERNKNKNELMNLGQANLERIFGTKAKSLQITDEGIRF